MSEFHNLFIRFRGSPQHVLHSSLYTFPSLRLPTLAGAVDKLALPEGMQTVNFSSCHRLTGIRLSVWKSDGHNLFNTFLWFSTRFLIPQLILSPLSSVGDVAQLRLPDSMRFLMFKDISEDLDHPMQITGTCEGT